MALYYRDFHKSLLKNNVTFVYLKMAEFSRNYSSNTAKTLCDKKNVYVYWVDFEPQNA